MTKFVYSIFAVLALSCIFVACNNDDEDEVINYSTTPEQASAGTYNGTWTRTSNGVTETFSGSVTLSAGGSTGVTNITFSCPGASLNASAVANVWNSFRDFQFVNQIDTNGLGAAFAGRVNEAGELTSSFNIQQRSGRTLVTYVYSFVGNK